MDQKALYQIFRACRLCGAEDGYKMPIIQNFIDMDDSGVQLLQKISDSLQTQVYEGDKMPPLICEHCAEKVDDYYAFKEQCKQIDESTRKKLGLPLPAKLEKLPTVKDPDEQKEKALAKKEMELKNKEAKLKERDIELKSRDKALRVKEIELKHRENAVKVKETQVKNKEAQLKTLDTSLRNKDVELNAKSNELNAKSNELKAKEQLIDLQEKKKKDISVKEGLLKKKEAMLKKKESDLKKMASDNSKKLANERSKLRKEMEAQLKAEILKASITKQDVDMGTLNSVGRSSRASSVSGKPSKQAKKSEEVAAPTAAVRTECKADENIPISQLQTNKESDAKLKQSKEPEASSDAPPVKKAKLSPKSSEPSITAKQELTCVVCSSVFKTNKAIKNHMRMHHAGYTNPRHVCNACHLWFHNLDETNAHHKRHATMNIPYNCSNCEGSFPTVEDYQEHFSLLDCYIYTVPDVQCGECWKYFATETLKSQHQCPGEDARGPGSCSLCKKEFPLLKDAKEHEATCTHKPPGPAQIIADPEVLSSILPVQVRTARCDDLLRNAQEDHVDVSTVTSDHGLDKSCVYPYFSLYPRIKEEPGYNYFDGMVKIHQDIKEEFIDDFVHWDSEESENESCESTPKGEKQVKSLSKLALKVVFSNKLIGKVPKKIRKSRSCYDSVLNVSIFGLDDNVFNVDDNMGDTSAAVDDITDNFEKDRDNDEELVDRRDETVGIHTENCPKENNMDNISIRDENKSEVTDNVNENNDSHKIDTGLDGTNVKNDNLPNDTSSVANLASKDDINKFELTNTSIHTCNEPKEIGIDIKEAEKDECPSEINDENFESVFESNDNIESTNAALKFNENMPIDEKFDESKGDKETESNIEIENDKKNSEPYIVDNNTEITKETVTASEKNENNKVNVENFKDIEVNFNNVQTNLDTTTNNSDNDSYKDSFLSEPKTDAIESSFNQKSVNTATHEAKKFDHISNLSEDIDQLEPEVNTNNIENSTFHNPFKCDNNIPFLESQNDFNNIANEITKSEIESKSNSTIDFKTNTNANKTGSAETSEIDVLMKDLNELSNNSSESQVSQSAGACINNVNSVDLDEKLAGIQNDIDVSESKSLSLSNVSDEEFNFSS